MDGSGILGASPLFLYRVSGDPGRISEGLSQRGEQLQMGWRNVEQIELSLSPVGEMT